MATISDIEAAQRCAGCARVLGLHLAVCWPAECGVVRAYAAGPLIGRAAALLVMLRAPAGAHAHHDHRVVCAGDSGSGLAPAAGVLEAHSDTAGCYVLHPAGFVIDLDPGDGACPPSITTACRRRRQPPGPAI